MLRIDICIVFHLKPGLLWHVFSSVDIKKYMHNVHVYPKNSYTREILTHYVQHVGLTLTVMIKFNEIYVRVIMNQTKIMQ